MNGSMRYFEGVNEEYAYSIVVCHASDIDACFCCSESRTTKSQYLLVRPTADCGPRNENTACNNCLFKHLKTRENIRKRKS